MNKFLYKTIIVFIFLLFFYHMTIGSKIREIESKIENFKSEENINSVKAKIRDEMNNAILKDKYLSVEDAKLIRNYIEKIKKELNY